MEINYDFNGSLKLTDVVEDFFYSKSTDLYIFRHPIIVDDRLLEAADELGIKITASPEKWLVNITLSDCLKILEKLGSTTMSLPEYFKIRKDAIESNEMDMVQSLESNQFIEMLSTVFIHDKVMVHKPKSEAPLQFTGEEIPVDTPEGRYGWFHPDNVDPETGLPTFVGKLRNIGDNTFKYWDTHTDIGKESILMAVRGYVTSVGKISLDLGFPADAISHRLSIRECKKTPPKGALDEDVLDEAKEIFAKYYRDLEDKSIYEKIPDWHPELIEFINKRIDVLKKSKDVASKVLIEDIYDVLGIMLTVAKKHSNELSQKINRISKLISGLTDDSISDELFFNFIKSRKKELANAFKNHKSIVFVMGHNNPDTDTVVSALAEAFRQQLLHGNESQFIPVVPGKILPEEIIKLLGKELSKALIYSEDKLYKKASTRGRPEWIMVDHNIGPEQPDTRAIIDHHYPSDICLRQQIPRRIIFAGSTTGLVALRIYGAGLEIPGEMARILQGAALMDTENRFVGKMTPLDELIMDRLQNSSGINDESHFYQDLMRELISCYNADELFIRDYKEDWSFFGFAVAKGIKLLDKKRKNIIRRLVKLAHENNKSKNLPLTLVKIVDYDSDAETIRKERAYPVFIKNASEEFRTSVHKTIETVISHESGDDVKVKVTNDYIEYWGVGTQLSRKKLAPVLELVVNAYNQYFYSPSTNLYFKRDFLKKDPKLEDIAEKNNMQYHFDDKDTMVGNPGALKLYLQETGYLCASPSEYFKAYFDAVKINDVRMVSHLTSSNYLETLDALVVNKQEIIEHPEISKETEGFSYTGTPKKVKILKGEPGLIDPKKINLKTGLPTEVKDPRQYGTGLWRYWSPDSDCAWVLRSTIFAYDMPALDLKFHFKEALPRLTIRPCTKEVTFPKVTVYEKTNSIVVDIEE